MRFCVIGAGAMGGAYGLSLVEAGYKVNFLDVNRDHFREQKGVYIIKTPEEVIYVGKAKN